MLEAVQAQLAIEDWGNGYSIFGGTTGGDVYCGEQNGERWTLIASGLAPISKKGHERLLAAS